MTGYKELAARLNAKADLWSAQCDEWEKRITESHPEVDFSAEIALMRQSIDREAASAIEALEAELDELIAWFDGLTPNEMHDSIKSQVDRASAAEARWKRLEEALSPIIDSLEAAASEYRSLGILPGAVEILTEQAEAARLALQENTNGG